MGKYFKKSELVFAEKSKHGRFKDIEGERHGRLVVIGFAGSGKDSKWYCECDCGNVVRVLVGSLMSGKTSSCGCYNSELLTDKNLIHGSARRWNHTPAYRSWCSIKHRCLNPNSYNFQSYGGRGIKICDRWKNSFKNFLEDMGERPDGTSIDRINNDGNYEPGNCRWATKKEQNNNKRANNFLTYKGKTMTIAQWSDLLNMNEKTLWGRIYIHGWAVSDAISMPVSSVSDYKKLNK